jgi:hypothetical protein
VDCGQKNSTICQTTNNNYDIDSKLEGIELPASDNNSESIDMMMCSNMKIAYSRMPDRDNPIDEFSFLSEIPDEFFTFED